MNISVDFYTLIAFALFIVVIVAIMMTAFKKKFSDEVKLIEAQRRSYIVDIETRLKDIRNYLENFRLSSNQSVKDRTDLKQQINLIVEDLEQHNIRISKASEENAFQKDLVKDQMEYLKGRLQYMEGQFAVMREVPVLRQYVKEFVPILATEEQKKAMADKMREQASEWESIYGFPVQSSEKMNTNVPDMVRPEDTV